MQPTSLEEFKNIINSIKVSILLKERMRKNIVLLNDEGVKFKFLLGRYSRLKSKKHVKNIAIECIIYNNKTNKIIEVEGPGNIYKHLLEVDKLDLVIFSMEEWLLKSV